MNNGTEKDAYKHSALFDGLERRLLKLSVDVEDKEKDVRLLRSLLVDEENETVSKCKSRTDDYQIKWDQINSEDSAHRSELLELCNCAVEEKMKLVSSIAHLQQKLEQEQEVTTSQVNDIKDEVRAMVRRAFIEWKEGEKKRQSNFMNDRVKHIRRKAIKAMEPKMKHMLQKVHNDVIQISSEMETRKKCLRKKLYDELTQRIETYTSEIRRRQCAAIDDLKHTRENQILKLQQNYQREMADIEQKHRQTIEFMENRHQCNLNDLQHDNASNIQQIRTDMDRSIKNQTVTIGFLKGNKEKKSDHGRDIDSLTRSWYLTERTRQEKELKDQLQQSREIVLHDRDAEIDRIILDRQVESYEQEEWMKSKLEDSISKLNFNSHEVAALQMSELCETKAKLASASDSLQMIQKDNVYLKRKSDSNEDKIERMKCQLVEMKGYVERRQHEELFRREQASVEGDSDIRTLIQTQQYLKAEENMLLKEIDSETCSHESAIQNMLNTHNEELRGMEMEVKAIMLSATEKCQVLDGNIKTALCREEKMREILQNHEA